MKTEIDQLKDENGALKQELFVMKEVVTKHETVIQSPSDSPEPIANGSSKSAFEYVSGNSDQHESPEPPIVEQQRPSQLQSVEPLLLLTDSNGKRIQANLLCPDRPMEHHLTYRIKDAKRVIEETKVDAKTIILHCGTNDSETMNPEQVINDTKSVLLSAKSKFQNSCIIYSSLLPRHDFLQEQIGSVNDSMKQFCNQQNIHFIDNHHISKQNQFYDFKHLNAQGFKFFTKNLKRALYNTETKASRNKHRRSNLSGGKFHNNFESKRIGGNFSFQKSEPTAYQFQQPRWNEHLTAGPRMQPSQTPGHPPYSTGTRMPPDL